MAVRSGLSSILLVYSAIAHCGEDAFAKWAATHAIPVTTVEPSEDFSDLLPLKSKIGKALVVALGEPMHGAHEPMAFRNRLIRFLVEQMGFTAVALESGFTESINARSFIEGGDGDVEAAAQTALPGLSQYLETRQLLQWMRDYNATADSRGHRKIRLYGLDITAGGQLSGPRLTIDSALKFLSRADPTTAQKIRDSLSGNLPEAESHELGPLPVATQAEFDISIEAIANAMQRTRKRLIASSSDEEYRWALHNLDAARQLAKCLPITPSPGASMRVWARTTACRDAAMAENVKWALKNEGRQGRLLVFAHVGHVMNWKEDGRRMAEVREKPPLMGFHLRREYGENLYIIAMATATTSGGLPAAKPVEADSIESALAGLALPLMFLDVRMARWNTKAFAWLSTPRGIDANVSAHSLITPSTALDAFLFIYTLTPAILSSGRAL